MISFLVSQFFYLMFGNSNYSYQVKMKPISDFSESKL